VSPVDLSVLLLAGAPLPGGAAAAPAAQLEEIRLPAFLAQADPAAPAAEPQPAAAESSPPDDLDNSDVIVVVSDPRAPPGDPLVELNQQSFEVTQAVDAAVVEPIAETYEKVLPKPVRSGLRNFFRNLASPVIFLNYMLQLKPGKAFETLGRFAVNSTLGLAGFVDVAKDDPFNLPHRSNGFANTLGYYGVGPGPYFYLPLIGSTTLRDMIGGGIDGLVMPLAVGAPFDDPRFTLPRGALRSIDYRVEYDEQIDELIDDIDPYTTLRERYLAARKAEIDALRGIRHDAGAFDIPGWIPGPAAPAEAVPAPQEPLAADPAPLP